MEATDFSIAGYRKGVDGRHLMASRCVQCNNLYFPPRPICPHCHKQEMTWEEIGGEGKILGYTVVTVTAPAMAARGYGRNNPYISAIVQLDDGPSIAARIEGADAKNPQSVHVGMAVKADYLEEGEGDKTTTTLVFRPK